MKLENMNKTRNNSQQMQKLLQTSKYTISFWKFHLSLKRNEEDNCYFNVLEIPILPNVSEQWNQCSKSPSCWRHHILELQNMKKSSW